MIRALAERGARARALIHHPQGAKALASARCEIVRGDITDAESLRAAAAGCETIVNLVAIISGRAAEFERVIAGGTRNALTAAQAAGTKRFVQMSALGVSEETASLVPYYAAKWESEQIVKASGVEHVILRPSFVFGPDGGALPRFLKIARLAPVTPIIGSGTQRLQPIWVDDIAEVIARATELPGEVAVTYEVGGPQVIDWNELWARMKEAQRARRPAVHLPVWLMKPQAALLELFPSPPLTRDQLKMLEAGDNVVTNDDARRAFPLDLVPLDEQLRRAL